MARVPILALLLALLVLPLPVRPEKPEEAAPEVKPSPLFWRLCFEVILDVDEDGRPVGSRICRTIPFSTTLDLPEEVERLQWVYSLDDEYWELYSAESSGTLLVKCRMPESLPDFPAGNPFASTRGTPRLEESEHVSASPLPSDEDRADLAEMLNRKHIPSRCESPIESRVSLRMGESTICEDIALHWIGVSSAQTDDTMNLMRVSDARMLILDGLTLHDGKFEGTGFDSNLRHFLRVGPAGTRKGFAWVEGEEYNPILTGFVPVEDSTYVLIVGRQIRKFGPRYHCWLYDTDNPSGPIPYASFSGFGGDYFVLTRAWLMEEAG